MHEGRGIRRVVIFDDRIGVFYVRSRLRQEACRGLLRIDIARRIAVLKATVTRRRAANQAADLLSVEVAVRVGAADFNGIVRIAD